MKIIRCDRCHREIVSCDWSPVSFPIVKIEIQHSIGNFGEIDLCEECKEEFLDWMRSKKENNND